VTPEGSVGLCGTIAITLMICLTLTMAMDSRRVHNATVCEERQSRLSSGAEYIWMTATSANRVCFNSESFEVQDFAEAILAFIL
jgi:hypothetical protein